MANSRKIELTDEKLRKLVEEKGEIVIRGRKIAEEMERLAKLHDVEKKQHEELYVKLNELKYKIIQRLKKVAHKELGEFEVPVTTSLEDGKLMFEIADTLADFKDSVKTFDKWRQAAPSKK